MRIGSFRPAGHAAGRLTGRKRRSCWGPRGRVRQGGDEVCGLEILWAGRIVSYGRVWEKRRRGSRGRLGGWRLPRNFIRGVRFAAWRIAVGLIFVTGTVMDFALAWLGQCYGRRKWCCPQKVSRVRTIGEARKIIGD